MHRLKKILLEQMDYESTLLERFEKEILTFPEGSLSLKKVKGNAYIYLQTLFHTLGLGINSYTFPREKAKSSKAYEKCDGMKRIVMLPSLGEKNPLHFSKKIYNKIRIYNKSKSGEN